MDRIRERLWIFTNLVRVPGDSQLEQNSQHLVNSAHFRENHDITCFLAWKRKNTWNLSFWNFSSKSGHQKYTAWVPGDPTQSCFCSMMCLWRNMQIVWTKLLQLSVCLVKQYSSFIYVERMSFCLVNWAFPFVVFRGPILWVAKIFHAYEG